MPPGAHSTAYQAMFLVYCELNPVLCLAIVDEVPVLISVEDADGAAVTGEAGDGVSSPTAADDNSSTAAVSSLSSSDTSNLQSSQEGNPSGEFTPLFITVFSA